MVAEHRRSIGAMVWLEPYTQPFLLMVILGVSMVLHEVWILDGSYATDNDDFNVSKGVFETAVDSTGKISHMNSTVDLAGWYRSSAWKTLSGISRTADATTLFDEIFGEEEMHLDTNVRGLFSCEKREGHSAAMNSTCEVPTSNYNVPDLRAVLEEQIESELNDSHAVQFTANIRGAVGVNELMIWHGMFLLLMYIIDGVSRCFSNFFSEKTYGTVTLLSGAFQCGWICC